MKLLASVLLFAVVAAADEVELDEGVLVGTDSNFASIVEDNEYVLAEFYAPWCGHCKQLAPEYATAASSLAEAGSAIKLVKIDATEQEDVASKYDVSGFPTLKWFKNGVESEYTGGRTADEIVQWVTKKSGPPAVPCDSEEACNVLLDESSVSAFGFFSSAESDEAKAFVAAADTSDLTFVIVTDADIAAKYKAEVPSVVVFTDFDEKRFPYDGAFESEAIATFVTGASLPLVIEFTEEAAPKIFGGEVKSHYIVFAKFADESWADISAAFSSAAGGFKGKVLFITMDVSKEENGRIMEFFGITEADVPTYRIINVESEMAKFKPADPSLTAEAFKAFAQDYVDGKLGRDMNSEDQPEDWDAKPVKVLVGGNFAEVALDEEKDVFVEFYAPWCGHCKALVPIWDQLAEAYESHDSVVVAKMDSTANEVEGVSVESFPTLKLFPKGKDAEAIDMDGDRTLSALAEFLGKQTGIEVEVPDEPEVSPGEEGSEGAGEGAGEDAAGGAENPHAEEL